MAQEPVSRDVDRYLRIVGQYDNEFAKWQARVKKIIKRYRDDTRGQSMTESAKFNILWSNVQTLIPAVYAKLPKADVSRRFGDNDPVGRVASSLLERALDFEIEHYSDFRSCMRHSVEDRFLGGRGTAWVRYEPHVAPIGIEDDGVQVTTAVEQGELAAEPMERVEYECAKVDYVHWRDFGHSQARTWEEVTCVWRWVYMTREALAERFGDEIARQIPLDQGPEPLTAYSESKRTYNRAKICELWDKETEQVYWFSKGYPRMIDVRDDPLGLEEFFPCPRPLYATTTSESLVPVPDFVLYQDQAIELDILSDRIDGLVKALRVRGVYDASQPALQRLLTEGDNNALIPVDKWMAFSEKGGLKGSIDLLPLESIAQALMQCYQARADIKGQIYEITGIADIIRGQSMASETATAQQIKGQYAGLRLRSMQEDVALYASQIIRLKAQVMAQMFQPQTILAYAAAQQMSSQDQQLIPQALELLKNNPLRNFRVDIAADSLVMLDEMQNKRDRLEFLQSFGGFLQQVFPVAEASPQLVPMMIDVMKFGVQAFKAARPLEGALDQALEAMQQAQGQPNPEAEAANQAAQVEQQKAQVQMQLEQAKMSADQQAESARLQVEQAKMAMQQQIEQGKLQMQLQIEQQRQQFEAQMKAQELAQKQEADRYKADLDAQTKILVARISANPGADIPNIEAQQSQTQQLAASLTEQLSAVTADLQRVMQGLVVMQTQNQAQHGETVSALQMAMQAMYAPKRIIRGADGRAAGVEVVRDQSLQ
jgi:hypothetical protein